MFFSETKESKPCTEPLNEQQSVTNFLASSFEFKKMKAIAERQKNNPEFKDLVDLVSSLEKSKSYGEISTATTHWDIPNNDNLIVYNLGRNRMNTIFYLTGFISDRGNFFYYALHFREKADEHSSFHSNVRYLYAGIQGT